ncbi:MAG TPA: D-glycero-beta-D-manno-heptose 1-phosphate adenylyltransferase [Chthonomonadaceae bacterium]|nr:D-glycero-beta-D-manno-heptose 1-phosphate adenylyltransferase [Chthonomonadaceae bacterium]
MGEVVRAWEELAAELEARRVRGERIVSTNGVFDVLHVGHVRYLQAARRLGDLLVVGVNTDAGTRRLKGPTRPFVPEAERAEMLAALACVDYVTFFDEPTPVALLETVRPHVHVKGGDYTVEELPETAIVRRYGGEVVTVPFVAGHSTTDLVARIAATLAKAGKADGER